MKLAKIIDDRFHIALNKLSGEALPLKTAFKLKGIMKQVREEYLKYDEVRREALSRHGEKNEDGSLKLDERENVQFSEEGLMAFTSELSELTNMELNIPTVNLSELGDKITITIEDAELLDGIIVVD